MREREIVPIGQAKLVTFESQQLASSWRGSAVKQNLESDASGHS